MGNSVAEATGGRVAGSRLRKVLANDAEVALGVAADVAVADFPCNVDSAGVEKALSSTGDSRYGAVVYRGDADSC